MCEGSEGIGAGRHVLESSLPEHRLLRSSLPHTRSSTEESEHGAHPFQKEGLGFPLEDGSCRMGFYCVFFAIR